MSTDPKCPDCGTTIPVGAPFGACPACLVQSAIEDPNPQDPSPDEPRSDDDSIPERIGSYQLIRKLGEGGFGEVYEARQKKPLQRRVALKLLKRGMDTRQVVARFEAERQALAMMDHPHVATVFEAGESSDGRPFFVMELVEGKPITEFCDEQRLTLPERLLLFMAVCEGVQHAHTKGIIHRDLKPSNVLVSMREGEPVPKVIDFGVAKATDQILTQKTIYTELGRFVGTPVYMSPEQARGGPDVDTRSDVYSLGALLYELLAGNTPFDHKRLREAGYGEMERILCEEEPPKPSTLLQTEGSDRKAAHLVRGELDWIVMRALEKDPGRRYGTAIGFAKDLERFLHDKPVEAGPPSRSYLLRKFARRNKLALCTAAAIAITLVAGTIVSTSQAIRATRAERDAKKQTQRALEAERLALEEAQVGDAVTTFLTEDVVVAAFGEKGFTPQGILAAVGEAEAGLTRLDDQPLVQAGGWLLLSRLFAGWGLEESAVTRSRRALEIYEKISGPTHEKTLQAAAVHVGQLIALGQWTNAESVLTPYLQRGEERYGPAHPRVQDLHARREAILVGRGRLAELLPAYRQNLAAAPTDHGRWAKLSSTHLSLGYAALRDGRNEEAVDHMLCATGLMAVHNWNGKFWQSRSMASRDLRRTLIKKDLIPAEWMDSTLMLQRQDPDVLAEKIALPSPQSALVKITLLERREDLAGALELFKKVVADAPKRHLFRHAYGLMLARAGREKEALSELHEALLDAVHAGADDNIRWYAASWNQLRTKLGLPLEPRDLLPGEPLIDPVSKHYYARLKIPLPWHDAKQACSALGGHLAIITTPEEDARLYKQFSSEHMCWLGATRPKGSDEWLWIDKTPMGYSNWGSSPPNNNETDRTYLAFGNQKEYLLFGRPISQSSPNWYPYAAHGQLTTRFDNNPIGIVVTTFPLCEWESEEAWRKGTRAK